MKKEDFTALGLSEELAERAAAASAEELKGMVPKTRLDEVITERNQLRTAREAAETDLEALRKTSAGNEALRRQIEQLQEAAKQKDGEHAAELRELKLTNAIRLAVTDAQDGDIVAGLLDKDKLILDDDGKVTGLDEQLSALREAKPFLFRPAQSEARGGFRVGVTPGGSASGVGREGGQLSMKEAIAARLSSAANN